MHQDEIRSTDINHLKGIQIMKFSAPNTDKSIPATADHVGAYFFHTHVFGSPNAPAISDNAAKLAEAMLNTAHGYEDSFLDINRSVIIGVTAVDYIGLEGKSEKLAFFNNNKNAVLEFIDDLIKRAFSGRRDYFLSRLLETRMSDGDMAMIENSIIGDAHSLTESQKKLRIELIAAIVNQVVYHSLSSFESLKQQADFIADYD